MFDLQMLPEDEGAAALWQTVVTRLALQGFYQYTCPNRIATAQVQAIQSGHLFAGVPERILLGYTYYRHVERPKQLPVDPSGIDGENVNEGQAKRYLEVILPKLVRFGVPPITTIRVLAEVRKTWIDTVHSCTVQLLG